MVPIVEAAAYGDYEIEKIVLEGAPRGSYTFQYVSSERPTESFDQPFCSLARPTHGTP
jgi:hypothetical protein